LKNNELSVATQEGNGPESGTYRQYLTGKLTPSLILKTRSTLIESIENNSLGRYFIGAIVDQA
jgi:hypothetical protein